MISTIPLTSLNINDTDNGIQINQLISLELKENGWVKVYQFEQLKDLQSVLTLFAPRNKGESGGDDETESVLERFIETFSGIIRLAELYMQLSKHGCSFFDNFKVEIFCNYSSVIEKNEFKSNGMIYLGESNRLEIRTGLYYFVHVSQNLELIQTVN